MEFQLFKILKDDAIKVLHSICQQIWKTQQWPQDLNRSILTPIPRKDSMKECSNHRTTVLISQASKVMLKILHARLQHYTNRGLPDVQTGFRKGRGTRDQIALIINKSPKCHTTCLLRNQYAGQEATVITGHEKMDWFQTGKGVRQRVRQSCISSPCLFNLYAEYIM